MTGTLTGNVAYDGGTIALLELATDAEDIWIGAEPRLAADLLVLHQEGEEVTVEYEGWQVI